MDFITQEIIMLALYVTVTTEVFKILLPDKWIDNPKFDIRAINLLLSALVVIVLSPEFTNVFEFILNTFTISMVSQGEYELLADILEP